MTVKIIRDDLTAQDLRAASGGAKDGRVARRLLAIAFVLEGVSRKTAAESCGMDRQTLRDWVHRYNAQGIAGLANRLGSRQVLTSRATVWCAGVVPIWRVGLKRSSVLIYTSALLASIWTGWAFGGSQSARNTPMPTRRRRKRSKKLPKYGNR